MMKFFLLLTASIILGSALYIILHFVFDSDKSTSVSISVSAAVAGLVAEYIRPYFKTLEQKQKDEISKRVRKNLNNRG